MTGRTKGADGDTRRRILLALLEANPASASEIAADLGLSAAAVRRHLDILLDEGLAEEAPAHGRRARGRGRPARSYRLTDAGRSRFGHGYDDLAAEALEALRDAGGEAAVEAFARRRAARILDGVGAVGDDADLGEVLAEVVEAFRRHGYAATINETAGNVQICHHHCPISHVAEDFPELCVAEHAAVGTLLGQHTQRLATIADGNGVCTTNIPLTPIRRPADPTHAAGGGITSPTTAPQERSGQ
ncbi:metalloregulator ArsR/SmtB family transcription factor [Corynebacterium sp.]|uniref:helix-turn-helix transcriptional regulator n=1 Tax=Corynebacterium sp. TaxID=1720 RepID=UPI0026DC17FC|nr:ArsR family transcriptional regulator [Corynebacterium sp.]MDO4609390.1 ArsR family transcriptional regulator [Corynebacterium sp.]